MRSRYKWKYLKSTWSSWFHIANLFEWFVLMTSFILGFTFEFVYTDNQIWMSNIGNNKKLKKQIFDFWNCFNLCVIVNCHPPMSVWLPRYSNLDRKLGTKHIDICLQQKLYPQVWRIPIGLPNMFAARSRRKGLSFIGSKLRLIIWSYLAHVTPKSQKCKRMQFLICPFFCCLQCWQNYAISQNLIIAFVIRKNWTSISLMAVGRFEMKSKLAFIDQRDKY